MKPVNTETTNSILKGPEGSGVIDLPITRLQGSNGEAVVESCWELSEKELEEVVRSRRVYFMCLGATHPPILISTSSGVEECD
ncbi:MAG: hypothetical protein ACRC7N_21315 [Clostridium sp.]